jgi:hypothetical protein
MHRCRKHVRTERHGGIKRRITRFLGERQSPAGQRCGVAGSTDTGLLSGGLGYRYSAAATPSSVDGAGTKEAAASEKPSAGWQRFGCRSDGRRSAEQASGVDPAGAIPASR